MSVNPQTQSRLIGGLPREIRDAIYLELWRSNGLRQHILGHADGQGRYFCHWPCTADFELEDPLQQNIEDLRCQLDVPLGQVLFDRSHTNLKLYCKRLQSPWMNHWPCGDRAEDNYGLDAIFGLSTWGKGCGKSHQRTPLEEMPRSGVYMPMLLSCKLLSAECLQSIYRSTTFIFTDLATVQMFFGYCALPPLKQPSKLSIPPPAFFKYARSWELSLAPDFPTMLLCANHDLPGIEHRHDVYDFHWLRVNKFENLQSVKIWIAARSFSWFDSLPSFTGIKQFDLDGLRQILAPFKGVTSLVVSTPLGSNVGPEYGFVEDIAPVRLYKRGTGERYHPFLVLVEPDGTFGCRIYTSATREVRLGRNGGNHNLMEEV